MKASRFRLYTLTRLENDAGRSRTLANCHGESFIPTIWNPTHKAVSIAHGGKQGQAFLRVDAS